MSSITEQIISSQNITTLCVICERFFLEKYKLNVTQDTLHKTIPILLNKIIIHYNKNPPLPNVQEINKIAMQQMKDFVLSKINKQQPMQQPPIQPLLQPMQSMQQMQQPLMQPMQPLMQPMLTPENDLIKSTNLIYNPNDLYINESTETIPPEQISQHNSTYSKEKVSEDDFFLKLQDLENVRNSKAIVDSNNSIQNTPFLSPPNKPNTIEQFPQQVIIQQLGNSASIPRITKSIIINAESSRDWIYFHERTMFIWQGFNNVETSASTNTSKNTSTSASTNAPIITSTILLKQLLLPRCVAKNTPVIILEITGASNKTIELICILNTPGVNWDNWKCVNDGAIQNMSYPWTIKLLDENKLSLHMLGKDGAIIKSVSKLYNGNTQIVLEPFMNCIEAGTRLKIYKNGTYTIFNVLNIYEKNIILENDATELVDGIICNLGCQPYIILDM